MVCASAQFSMVPARLEDCDALQLELLPVRFGSTRAAYAKPLSGYCTAIFHARITHVAQRNSGVTGQCSRDPGRIRIGFFDVEIIVFAFAA